MTAFEVPRREGRPADTKSAADVLIEVLLSYGVQDIFCSPGSEWTPVWEALARRWASHEPAPRYWSCRHEALEAALCIGNSKVTRRLTAALMHAAVGPLNGAMAIRSAMQENAPMVILCGDSVSYGEAPSLRDRVSDPAARWLRHLSDNGGPARAAEAYVKWSGSVASIDALPGVLQHACRVALSPPQGPSLVSVAYEAIVSDKVPVQVIPRPAPVSLVVSPHVPEVKAAAELLIASERPLIVTETAGRDPANVNKLVVLAEALAAPVLECQSPAYLNFPRDHPLHLGYSWNELAESADVVLMIGVRGAWSPPSKHNHIAAKIVLVDEDTVRADAPTWGYSVDAIVTGQIGEVLDGLLAETSRHDLPGHAGNRRRQFRDVIASVAQHKQLREELGYRVDGAFTVDTVTAVLAERLPVRSIVVPETASLTRSIMRQFPQNRPGSFLGRMTGGLGVGLGTALGVKMASPDDLVVCLMGDGTLNYNPVLPALGFSQEYNLPLLLVVANNGGYASMHKDLLTRFPDGVAAKSEIPIGVSITPVPDYASLAPMFGGFGATISDLPSLEKALDEAIAACESGVLALLDVRLD